MPSEHDVVQVTDPCAHHGEGPVWHPEWPGLRWVDMLAGDVLTLEPAGQVHRAHVGSVVAALRPRRGGGAVLALERGFALGDAGLTEIRALGELWSDPAVRMNEGGCDPEGRFYCGSMSYTAEPGRGALYRLDTDGAVSTVLGGVTISNGLAWSPDGTSAYYVDTPTQRVDVFDHVDGTLRNRRPVVRIEPELGAPDGLTVDAEGHLWVALWGGGAVHRYSPEGRLVDRIGVPASQVTACTFGGPGLTDLFVTTSRVEADLRRHPLSGALFRVPGAGRGTPVREYGG
ncbi:SMP-30/gluconolactonase/LRE family protein [Saccharopolyspora erythraea]|uniref:SMP-30/gluconolactonase/LRE family protein n=1 Tax=Saccharopolyspora erythraea TaxID=1836 RepID=UPI001BA5F71C|nr:SMP-30/gluconolactonase/LRE family protein [Saccharopolyspora erythraea]QUH02330.1 SMP-30/gluconolactonase/LRE family protein [Saccharopolyspora erythraea]